MKNLVKLPMALLFLMVSVSCSTDSNSPNSDSLGENPINDFNTPSENAYFGFLYGLSSANVPLDQPIESSSTNLLIGRWKITKIGIDQNDDGNVVYYNYQDYRHKDCGLSYLQFNNDGIVFENCYFNDDDGCILYTGASKWEVVIGSNLKISDYNNIFVVQTSDTELILKYDYNDENYLWAPLQVYYYYDRILATN